MTMRVAVILGPTATGKTRLAVTVAHRLGSEILSADSRQVYTGLDLGTGKDLEEYGAVSPPVPYHLIDICDPLKIYTLFDFQQDCYAVLRRCTDDERFESGAVPLLLVGGSGLYLEAVIREYRIADVPEDPVLRRRLMRRPLAELVEALRAEDPVLAARTDLASKKRVTRALEIVEFAKQRRPRYSAPSGLDLSYTVFGVQIDRELLLQRISDRVDRRLESGMVEEVKGLLDRGVPYERLQMLGMEYREIAAHLMGEKDFERMVTELKQRIAQLAKRQMTYYRGMERRGIPIRWVEPSDSDAILGELGADR
jgi:tRNA dimethylallyltransferase